MDDIYWGLVGVRGVLRNDAEHLVLEFETKDNIVGLLSSEISETRVRIGAIEEIGLRQRILGLGGAVLRIRTMDMASLKDIPGHTEDGIRLTIGRKYRRAARLLVSEVKLRIAEIRLAELEEQEA